LSFDDKINDWPIAPSLVWDGVAAKSLCALQMKIVACLLTRHKMRRRWSLGKNAHAPRIDSTIILLFIFGRETLVDSIAGLFSILVPSQIHSSSRVLMQLSESMGEISTKAAR